MSERCPYDGEYCQKKVDYFESWAEAVEYAAENRLNIVFWSSADAFAKCPLQNKEQCERYLKYCFMKNNEKQK